MQTIDGVRRSAVGIGPEQTIRDAAAIMEHTGVGALAIVDGSHLVGIVTDRDLVRRGLAKDLPADARIDSVMSAPVVTIDAAHPCRPPPRRGPGPRVRRDDHDR